MQALIAAPGAPGSDLPTDIEAIRLSQGLSIATVDDYVYQLQGDAACQGLIDPQALAQSLFDLIVVDYSKDGSGPLAFTPAEVAGMQNSPSEHRLVLAYLSISEGEDYRCYWPHPSNHALADPNPQWSGNYKVRYWLPEWKEIILHGNVAIGKSYLNRIIDAGFDGVFLDMVDTFEYFGPVIEGRTGEKDDAALAMMEFLLEIAQRTRHTRSPPDS